MFRFKRKKDRGYEVDVRVFVGPRAETRRAILRTLAALPLEPTAYLGVWPIKQAEGCRDGRVLQREVKEWAFSPEEWVYLQVSPWRSLWKNPLSFAFGNHVHDQQSAEVSLLTLQRSPYNTVILTEPTLAKKDVWRRYFMGKTVLIATERFLEVREALLEAEVAVLSLDAFTHELTHGLVPASFETGSYTFKEGQFVGLKDRLLN